ncbi:MAG: DNRLRE domain-containing protein [Gammaproteobacteria bacterium]|nr:DNRLRE domain-containing protein [Gammaproteobacteria bacterium]
MNTAINKQQGYVLITVVVTLFLLASIGMLLGQQSAMGLNNVSLQGQKLQARYIAEAGMQHAHWQSNSAGCTAYALPQTSFAGGSYSAVFTPDNGSPVNMLVKAQTASGAIHTIRHDQFRVLESMNTLVLQPGAAEAKDTYIRQWFAGRNYGIDDEIHVNGWWGDYHRGLMKFDLGAVAAGSQVLSATLELYSNTTSWSPATLNIHRMTRNWDEGGQNNSTGEASWNSAQSGQAWSAAGGDFDNKVYGTAVTPGAVGWVSWDVTKLVQEWVDGKYDNHGLMLRATALNEGAEFDSSDAADASKHPRLTIHYACECGKVCATPAPVACDADYTPSFEFKNYSVSFSGSNNPRSIVFLPEGTVFNGVTVPAEGAWTTIDTTTARIYLFDMAGTLLSELPTGGNFNGHGYVAGGLFANHLVMNGAGSTLVFMSLDGASQFAVNISFVSQVKAIAYIGKTASGSYDEQLMFLEPSQEILHIMSQTGTTITSFSVNDATPQGVVDLVHMPGTDKIMVSYTDHVSIYDFSGNLLRDYDLTSFGVSFAEGVSINPLTCDHVVLDDQANLVRYLEQGTGVLEHYLDEFSDFTCGSAQEYHGSNGSLDWTAYGWIENSDDGSACSGDIQAMDDPLYADPGGNRLRLTGMSRSVERQIDLGKYATAKLRFDYRRANTGAEVRLQIYDAVQGIWKNASPNITTGNDADYVASQTYDLGAYLVDGTRIRFVTGGTFTGEFYMDSVRIEVFEGSGSGGGGGGESFICNGTYADAFDRQDFANSTGTIDWSTSPWIEVGEADGVKSGDIGFFKDISNYQLRIQSGGKGVMRALDLGGAATATLRYDVRRELLDNANDYAIVEISADGASGPWTELARHQGLANDPGYSSVAIDISSFIGNTAHLRIMSSGALGNRDIVWFENLEVQCIP